MQIINQEKIRKEDFEKLDNAKKLLNEIYKTNISEYEFSLPDNWNHGIGGNGVVIKIRNKKNSNIICLKYLYNEEEKRKKRFINEVNITKKFIDNFNIISIIEDRNILIDKKEFYYYTMPYYKEYDLKGRTFYERINDLLILAKTIKIIHEKSIVHRDIKLSNLLLNNKNQPVLIDFGIAKKNNNQGIEKIEKDINVNYELTSKKERIGPYLISPPEFMYRENINMDYRKSDAYIFAKTAWQVILQDKIGFYGEYAKNKNIKYITLDSIKDLYPTEEIFSIEPINEMIFECTKDNIVERKNIDDCIFYLMKEREIIEGKHSGEYNTLNIKNTIIKSFCLTELESKTILINDNTYDDINKMLKECLNIKQVLLISNNKENPITINNINYNLQKKLFSLSIANGKEGVLFIGKSTSIKIFRDFSEVCIEFKNIYDTEKSNFSKYSGNIIPNIDKYYLNNGDVIKFQL